jgi:AhpD family alkylhydroperoxidase
VAFAEIAAGMEWGECWLEPPPVPPAFAAEIKKLTGGVLPTAIARTASVPWVGRTWARVVQKQVAHMPLGLWDLIGLVVSQDNSCRYCYGATRTMLRLLGHRDEQIDSIERDVAVSDLGRPERLALEFVRKVSHANPRPTALDRAALADAGFTPGAVGEIVFTAAFAGFPNRVATLFALQPEEFEKLPDRLVGRLVRPLIARALRAKRVPPPPAPPEPNTGPFRDLVEALAGSPKAQVVRDAIDDAFASSILPRRTKLLMIAVVGRALECGGSEREAREGLVAEGLTGADVDGILANLGSDKLDRRDALLVPFARETVRYQTGPIQRRTRELARELPTDELMEAVGVAALANALGRASILLETC